MPQPQHPIQFSYALNRPFLPLSGAEKVYVLLECKGVAADRTERAPINASLVLDRSGSMSGAPIEYSKQACKFVINQMDATDRLSLVAFDNVVETVFSPQEASKKDAMKRQIDTIQARGSTNLSGGLLAGIQFVMQGKREGTVNRVILLSDGHANEGITDPKRLGAIVGEFRSSGITVTTMGVGDGFDEDLMETIAENGSGNFYYIKQAEDIPGIFDRELQGLLQIVAQNLQVTLTPAEEVVITGVYGYMKTEAEAAVNVSLGDMYRGEDKSVLIELAVPRRTGGEHPLLSAEWSYVDVTEGAALNGVRMEIQGHFTDHADLLGRPSVPKVEKQIHITESALIIEHAMTAFDSGDVEQGKVLLKHQADKMHAFAVMSGDAEVGAESRMLHEQLQDFTYDAQKRKELHAQKVRTMKRRKM